MRSPDGKFECGNDAGRSPEVTNMMDIRKAEVLFIQETKCKGNRTRALAGGYKMLHVAGGDGNHGQWTSVSQRKSVRTW